MVGTSFSPSSFAASIRPCPATTRFSLSMRTGLLKPNSRIEAAICKWQCHAVVRKIRARCTATRRGKRECRFVFDTEILRNVRFENRFVGFVAAAYIQQPSPCAWSDTLQRGIDYGPLDVDPVGDGSHHSLYERLSRHGSQLDFGSAEKQVPMR